MFDGYDVVTNDEGTTMEFNEYLVKGAERIARGGERDGQAYMNVLVEAKPHLYNAVTGTDLDPFYNEWNFTAFFEYLGAHWNDETEKCYVCGREVPVNPYGEACDYCMSGAEYHDYQETNPYDTPGAWQDSTFPNEY